METQHRRPIMEMLRRYWMLPYQASGISGKSPEDGGGEEEEESGGVAAAEKLRCIAIFFPIKASIFKQHRASVFLQIQ